MIPKYKLPAGLPLLRSIQHQVDLVPDSIFPHYRMNPKEHQILNQIMEDLLQKKKKLIQRSLSPCVTLALIIPTRMECGGCAQIVAPLIQSSSSVVSQCHRVTVFSKLALRNRYQQIHIRE